MSDHKAPLVADRNALVKVLTDSHFDGRGCGTTEGGACSICYGPSPMSAHEVVDLILSSGLIREVPAPVADRAPSTQRLNEHPSGPLGQAMRSVRERRV